jgi:hypothetical protein
VKVLRPLIILAAIVTVALAATPAVYAETYGGGSVQSYAADAPFDNGTIVQLTGKNSNRVKIALQADLQNMFGVTVDRNQLPLTVTNEGVQNETFVAVSGTYNLLVSTQGGPIAPGDYVTLSSLNGVAMKAGTEEKTVFGRAAAPFDGKGITLSSISLKDSAGKEDKKVSLGLIPVTIDIRSNPNQKTTKANLPSFLERAGLMIAEKPVSPIRIYLSIGVASICVIAAIVIIYAGVRNGVISIGRNPMSRKSIFRALIETILASLLILIIGMFAVYLLLKL